MAIKKNKIIFVAIVMMIVVMLAGNYCLVQHKNKRYTGNLRDYTYFVGNVRNEHYTEEFNQCEVIIWDSFEMLKINSMAQVEIKLRDVYWKQQNDFINISLHIRENMWGDMTYAISYESNPVFVKNKSEDKKRSVMEIKNKGYFSIGEENPDAEKFYSENKEAVSRLFEEAEIYFNISFDDIYCLCLHL